MFIPLVFKTGPQPLSGSVVYFHNLISLFSIYTIKEGYLGSNVNVACGQNPERRKIKYRRRSIHMKQNNGLEAVPACILLPESTLLHGTRTCTRISLVSDPEFRMDL